MEDLFIPEYLKFTQEQWDQNLKEITTDKTNEYLEVLQKNEKIESELLDQMIENAKHCTDEMIALQIESNKINEHKQNLMKDLTELELTVKDCQEEIEAEKEACKNIESQIQEKSDSLNSLNQSIDAEKVRINSIVDQVKSKYNYYKSTVKLFSNIFNCELKAFDENSQVFNLILKDELGNDEVVVQFKIEENFPASKNIELLDIKLKSSSPLEPEILKDMKEMLKESQDTQGLLSFLHKNYVK